MRVLGREASLVEGGTGASVADAGRVGATRMGAGGAGGAAGKAGTQAAKMARRNAARRMRNRL